MTSPNTGRSVGPGDRYRLDSHIATGGMGEVWSGVDTLLNRPVAVKLLKREYADDALFRTRFEIEARNAAALHHPGVAAVFDFGEDAASAEGGPRPYLVMELVAGQPLSALLRPDSPMEGEVARDLVAQAASAIGAAHRAGIVHRDVKPANLLVTPSRQVKITDFGIARAAEGMALTQTGQVIGTPHYISPEQAQGETATPASDVYALGCVLFECLTGRRAFNGDSPVTTALAHLRDPVPELPDFVPAPLAAVVRRCLAKDPAERYATGDDLATALHDPEAAAAAIVPGAVPGASAGAPGDSATQVLPSTGDLPAAAVPATRVDAGAIPPGTSSYAAPGAAGGPGGPGDRDERDRRGTPAWVWPALVLLALIIGLLGWQALGGTEEDPPDQPTATRSEPTRSPEPTPEESPTESVTPDETIRLNESDYLGRPVDVVEQEIEALGLKVNTVEVPNDGSHEEGNVDNVAPLERRPGEEVIVTYYGKPEEPEPTAPTEPTEPTEPTSPTESPSPTATDSPTESPTDGPGGDGGDGGEGGAGGGGSSGDGGGDGHGHGGDSISSRKGDNG